MSPLDALRQPVPLERLAFLRITAPLAILGFMSSRIAHADHWLGVSGFAIPDLGGPDYRQPIYLAPLPDVLAWALGAVMVVSGLMLAAGWRTRPAGFVFAATLFYVALADRLAAFTVSKISGPIVLCLAFSAAGARWGVDAWLAQRRSPEAPRPTHGSAGELRVLQAFLIALYTSSGLCKARGDWLSRHDILWTHLHDAYQTAFSHAFANLSQPWMWPVFQGSTLIFEFFAALWFLAPATRLPAMGFGLLLHLLIGLMFGPIVWFSLLMMALLLGCYAPVGWLRGMMARLPG